MIGIFHLEIDLLGNACTAKGLISYYFLIGWKNATARGGLYFSENLFYWELVALGARKIYANKFQRKLLSFPPFFPPFFLQLNRW